jgi:hypothetical protein
MSWGRKKKGVTYPPGIRPEFEKPKSENPLKLLSAGYLSALVRYFFFALAFALAFAFGLAFAFALAFAFGLAFAFAFAFAFGLAFAFTLAFAFGLALAFDLDVAFFLAVAIMHLSRLLMRVPRVQK